MHNQSDRSRLTSAFLALSRQLDQTLLGNLPPGMTVIRYLTLDIVQRDQPIRMSGITEQLGMAARSVTEIVDHLESSGLTSRRTDPSDRRAVLVETTPRGDATVREMLDVIELTAQQLFAPLSDEAVREMLRAFQTLDPHEPS